MAGILQVTLLTTETQIKLLTIQNYSVANTRGKLQNAMKTSKHKIKESDDSDT